MKTILAIALILSAYAAPVRAEEPFVWPPTEKVPTLYMLQIQIDVEMSDYDLFCGGLPQEIKEALTAHFHETDKELRYIAESKVRRYRQRIGLKAWCKMIQEQWQ